MRPNATQVALTLAGSVSLLLVAVALPLAAAATARGSLTVIWVAVSLSGYLALLASLAAWALGWPRETLNLLVRVPIGILLGAFLLVLLTGELASQSGAPGGFAFAALLGAGLPPYIALAVALRRLQAPIKATHLLSAILIGSSLSPVIAVVLEAALPVGVAALVLPARDLISDLLRANSLEDLLFNRGLVLVLINVAIVAPVAEELAKPVAVAILGHRVRDRREAMLLGMAGGVGFAVLENLLYESIWYGEDWVTVTAVRGVGGVLHPLGAGLVGVAIFDLRARQAGWPRVVSAYALAVAIHMAWNGGLVMLYATLGDRIVTNTALLQLGGIQESTIVVAWLVLLSALMWRLLYVVTGTLRETDPVTFASVASLGLDHPRRLALVASGLLFVALTTGSAWGPVLARQIERTFG